MKKKIIVIVILILIILGVIFIKMSKDDTQYNIGIGQFADHVSLDNCREGFIEGLRQEGIVEGENLKIDYQNANADGGTANLIANMFVSENYDLVLGIATPMAQSLFNATQNTNIPVVFSAVTFPETAGLTDGNVTGTSDKFSANERLKLIRDILPNAKKIGVIYCTSEVNATQSLKELKDLAYNYDFEIVEKGVATASDIALATNNIVKDVDCICLVIDNTVSASLPNIIEIATNNGIPVFCNEEDEVKLGGLACNGIDYKSLGIETGKIAAQILKGEKKANEIEYKCIEDTILYVNSETFDKLNINLPNQLKDNCIDVIESE